MYILYDVLYRVTHQINQYVFLGEGFHCHDYRQYKLFHSFFYTSLVSPTNAVVQFNRIVT